MAFGPTDSSVRDTARFGHVRRRHEECERFRDPYHDRTGANVNLPVERGSVQAALKWITPRAARRPVPP